MIDHSRARQWSRAAWSLAALFGSLPLAGKIFLGSFGFPGAAELSFVFFVVGTYLHIVGRRRFRALRDDALNLDRANRLAANGQTEEAIGVLTGAIRRSPRLWQAYQYRGELHLRRESWDAALRDFTEAIQLAPGEAHLYALRGQAHRMLGNDWSARGDAAAAEALERRLPRD